MIKVPVRPWQGRAGFLRLGCLEGSLVFQSHGCHVERHQEAEPGIRNGSGPIRRYSRMIRCPVVARWLWWW